MKFEVEQKFPVSDMLALQERLISLGAKITDPQLEVDLYFAHPARDFAITDEALRIRRKGPKNFLTYKGPKIDSTTKTRQEIDLELPLGEESARSWCNMFAALGFTTVCEVSKRRSKVLVHWQNREIECSLDDVESLGHFCELELLTDHAGLEPAKACIASLAAELGLKKSERRSYLELLLEAGDYRL
ncbi:MAG TPA: class IV adenylate cyclase [Thermoguttaceae bacterium]